MANAPCADGSDAHGTHTLDVGNVTVHSRMPDAIGCCSMPHDVAAGTELVERSLS